MIAVDTNILVYAHRRDSVFHEPAARTIRGLAESSAPWCIPWPCIHEFYSTVTRPAVFEPPSTPEQAFRQVRAWAASPTFFLLHETDDHLEVLSRLVIEAHVVGPMVHDARIAAICLAHGVSELLTADRDFGRFSGLRTRNPLTS